MSALRTFIVVQTHTKTDTSLRLRLHAQKRQPAPVSVNRRHVYLLAVVKLQATSRHSEEVVACACGPEKRENMTSEKMRRARSSLFRLRSWVERLIRYHTLKHCAQLRYRLQQKHTQTLLMELRLTSRQSDRYTIQRQCNGLE
jgi:hypothetical protein